MQLSTDTKDTLKAVGAILLFVVVAFFAIGTFAEWTKPEPHYPPILINFNEIYTDELGSYFLIAAGEGDWNEKLDSGVQYKLRLERQ